MEWAEAYGLRLVNVGGLRDILPQNAGHMALGRQLDAILDHSKAFTQKGSSKIVVVVSAPYLKAMNSKYGSPNQANHEIHSAAESLGLRVRVGHPRDTIYLSGEDNDPTVPIVWWNPKDISLPFPQIEDPNPRFADRMEPEY